MSSLVVKLANAGVAHPPAWLPTNIQLEVIMGSRAYGVNSPDADYDTYGFAIPPKDVLFPHLAGVIPGFGFQGNKFEQYEQGRMVVDGKEYSFNIYSIVKFFQLCMDNNPNMLDSLFVPINCVTYCSNVGALVRDNRKLFLSKRCWPKFKGYAFQQLHNMDNKNPVGKRAELVKKHNFDTKYAYNLLRLLDECEQLLTLQDMDLQRAREQMKAVKRGDWTEEQVRSYFYAKLPVLEKAYSECTLPDVPDESKLKALLMNCLEMHYGNLRDCVVQPDATLSALRDIQAVLDRNKSLLY